MSETRDRRLVISSDRVENLKFTTHIFSHPTHGNRFVAGSLVTGRNYRPAVRVLFHGKTWVIPV